MSDVAGMSVTSLVAVAAVVLVLGIVSYSATSLFELSSNQMRGDWIGDELRPEVEAACEENDGDLLGSYFPDVGDSDSYLQRDFNSNEFELREEDAEDSDEYSTRYVIAVKGEEGIDFAQTVATSQQCDNLDLDGNLDASGVKKFRAKIENSDEAVIEVE